jgi:hypothetical protein
MAKVFRAPIDPPVYNHGTWQQDEEKYLAGLAAAARKHCPGGAPLVGELLRWPRGDGYALYMVWDINPLTLIWIEIGDAWSVEAALIRGLTLTEVRAMVRSEQSLRALFAGAPAKAKIARASAKAKIAKKGG